MVDSNRTMAISKVDFKWREEGWVIPFGRGAIRLEWVVWEWVVWEWVNPSSREEQSAPLLLAKGGLRSKNSPKPGLYEPKN